MLDCGTIAYVSSFGEYRSAIDIIAKRQQSRMHIVITFTIAQLLTISGTRWSVACCFQSKLHFKQAHPRVVFSLLWIYDKLEYQSQLVLDVD